MIRWTAFLLLIAPVFALGGTVETNVQVCGTTAPYTSYGQTAFGIFGSSSTGLKDKFFRVRGYLNIDSSTNTPQATKGDVIADFVAMSQLRGIQICVNGNLETVQKPDKTYYRISPRYYQLMESPEGLLNPSDLPGKYSLPHPAAPTLFLKAIDDSNSGRRFVFTGLTEFLSGLFGTSCAVLEKAVSAQTVFSMGVSRRSRLVLALDESYACSKNVDDVLNVRVELRRTSADRIEGTIEVERTGTGHQTTLEIHRD